MQYKYIRSTLNFILNIHVNVSKCPAFTMSVLKTLFTNVANFTSGILIIFMV